MLERVEIIGAHSDRLQLPLQQTAYGLIVKRIEGLDPVKSTITTTSYASRAGSLFQSSRRESRNIVITLGLDSRYGGGTVEDIRRRINSFFMPDTNLRLRFYMTSGLVLETSGRVEDNINPLFTKEPEANISILCFDPDLIAPDPLTVAGEARSSLVEIPLEYDGNVPSGIEITLDMDQGVTSSGFDVYHRSPGGILTRLSFSAELQSLDTVQIRTHPGEKSAILYRQDDPGRSILEGISADSVWLSLSEGSNKVGVKISGPQSYYQVTYYNRYGSL